MIIAAATKHRPCRKETAIRVQRNAWVAILFLLVLIGLLSLPRGEGTSAATDTPTPTPTPFPTVLLAEGSDYQDSGDVNLTNGQGRSISCQATTLSINKADSRSWEAFCTGPNDDDHVGITCAAPALLSETGSGLTRVIVCGTVTAPTPTVTATPTVPGAPTNTPAPSPTASPTPTPGAFPTVLLAEGSGYQDSGDVNLTNGQGRFISCLATTLSINKANSRSWEAFCTGTNDDDHVEITCAAPAVLSETGSGLTRVIVCTVTAPTPTLTPTPTVPGAATNTPTPTPTFSPTPTPSATFAPTSTPGPTSSPTPTSSPSPSTTLKPVADARVNADAPSTSYGTSTQLIVDGLPAQEAYLRFDLTSLAGPVKDARLRLHVSNTSSAGTPWGGTVSRVNDVSWQEATLTYANRPSAWAPTTGAFGAIAANTWVEANVTSVVTTGEQITFGVRSTNTDGAYYDSRESGANAPQLVVTLGTPVSIANGVVVAAVGDAVCAPGGAVTSTTCRQMQVSDIVANDAAVQVFLALGDLQYENGELANFQSAYDSSYGRFWGITRPAPGNHEYNTAGAPGYYTYFGAAAGDPAKGYYSFDVGTTWHVVALNSNCATVPCSVGSAQEQWLRADLAATDRACVLAYWHHPRFSSGSHGNNTVVAPFWDALQARGAELMLAGHDHGYERFAPQLPSGTANAAGITQFIVGTGGKSLAAFGTTKANSVLRFGSFGVLRLALGDGAYTWRFVDEAGGTLDSGTGVCH